MKKEILGYDDQLHFYDQYTPLIANPYAYVEYEPGKEIIYNALAPLGEQYIADLKKGLSSRWADVYTTEGKYEGGYQWGTYDTDPFVLLNFNNYMTDVSTVAHEMGHALNFKYTNDTQGYFSSNVPIFNAEIASTTNEAMVFEYRIANATTPVEKQQALLSYIELIENTIFTQMIYADFEKRAYEAYEAGEPINAELFNTIMGDVLVEYYGPDYALDETATYQWSEIPHFYNSYYVYKYATGLSAGLTFADNVINGSQSDVDKYLTYLKSGSSQPSLVLLKNAGVDFSTGEPMQRAFDRFESLIDEFKETIK
jgi:oligoendopeptidase F